MQPELEPTPIVKQAKDLRTLAVSINKHGENYERDMHNSLLNAKQAGEQLIECQKQIPYGQWLSWLEANIRLKRSQIYNFMRVARNWDQISTGGNLSVKAALRWLYDEESDREPGCDEKEEENQESPKPPEPTKTETQHMNGKPQDPKRKEDPPSSNDLDDATWRTVEDAPAARKDEVGHILPDNMIQAFATLKKIEAARNLASELESLIDEISRSEGGERIGEMTNATDNGHGKTIQRLTALNDVKGTLKVNSPYSLCPRCKGAKTPNCMTCCGYGWVRKDTWNDIDQSMKNRLEIPA